MYANYVQTESHSTEKWNTDQTKPVLEDLHDAARDGNPRMNQTRVVVVQDRIVMVVPTERLCDGVQVAGNRGRI